jgi:hypothetical protein
VIKHREVFWDFGQDERDQLSLLAFFKSERPNQDIKDRPAGIGDDIHEFILREYDFKTVEDDE